MLPPYAVALSRCRSTMHASQRICCSDPRGVMLPRGVLAVGPDRVVMSLIDIHLARDRKSQLREPVCLVRRPFRAENCAVVALRRRVNLVPRGRLRAGRWGRVWGPSLLPPLVFGRARGLVSVFISGPTGDHPITIRQG